MDIQAQIAYYPLAEADYRGIVRELLAEITATDLDAQVTPMATIVKGEQSRVLGLVERLVTRFFARYASILQVTFSNACG